MTALLPPLTELESAPPPRPRPVRSRVADAAFRLRLITWQQARVPLALTALIVLAAVVHAWGMFDSPARVDDEGTYVAQAWALQHWGELAHYTYWYDHPPVGWMQIAAWTTLTGAFERAPNAVAAGRELMLVAKVVSCGLLYLLARRLHLRPAFGMVAVALFAFSPLALGFQRMAYLDNLATPWLLGAFVLALTPRRSLAAYAGSAACFAICVLTKETTLLLLPALLWQVWQGSHRSNRHFGLIFFFSVMITIGALYPLYALLKNELLPGPGHVSLLEAIQWQLFERAGSGSVFDPTSPARGVVDAWLGVDHFLVVSGAVLAPVALLFRRLRPVALAMIIQLLALLREGYLPFPYVIGLIPFAALLVAGVSDGLWPRLRAAAASGAARARTLPTAVQWTGAVPVVIAALFAVTVMGPAWSAGTQRFTSGDMDAGMTGAQEWVLANVPRDARLVVDDALWVDFVRAGFDPDLGVIWFYKLDLDPAIVLPEGLSSVDYVVLADNTENLDLLPKVSALVEHSTVVERFGIGDGAVTVYEVDKTSIAAAGDPA